MIIRILFAYLALMLLFGLLGMFWVKTEKPLAFLAGLLLALALFEPVALACIFTRQSLGTLVAIYGGLLLACAVASAYIHRKRLAQLCAVPMRGKKWEGDWRAYAPLAVAILLVAVEMCAYVAFTHIDDDDAFFVATATTALEDNSLFAVNPYTGAEYQSFPMRYVLSPFPLWNACCSKLLGLHPTVFAHNVMPLLFLTAAFLVYFLFGRELFRGDVKRAGYFVIFCIVIQMWSGYTTHPVGMVALVRLWQGKAVLASVLIPTCFYLALRLLKGEGGWRLWSLCLLLMCACCLVSSMGIMLGPIAIGLLGLLLAWKKKSIQTLICAALCCVPNLVLAVWYLLS